MNDRPKPETLPDGTKIVYPIWREDLAEATIIPGKFTEVPVETLKLVRRPGPEEWRAK